MHLTLDALTVLESIHRNGSFAAAAKELHRVPSAVSYSIQKLEETLGILIFDRNGHRAALTPAGEVLLTQGRELLRAAGQLEIVAKRAATGWESRLRIAVNALIPLGRILKLLEQFYQTECGTQIRLSRELLSGTWDALLSDRADLVIGASGNPPASGEFLTQNLGDIEMVFVIPPGHPLTTHPGPISNDALKNHRAIAIADSARQLPAQTAELLTNQDVLTVPDLETKLSAHRAGLGVGTLPAYLARPEIDAGRLLAPATEREMHSVNLKLAWRKNHEGKAMNWFIQQLRKPEWQHWNHS